jgi:hypothetical protein
LKASTLVVILFLAAATSPATTFTVTNTDDSGPGSLRQAILDANANAGSDTIAFDIPGSGVHRITPATALPQISEAVVIDGYTQPGSGVNTDPDATNAVLLIELDGTAAGGVGLNIATNGGSTVQGLVINGWSSAAIISSSGPNTIRGNFFGTDPTGTFAKGDRGMSLSNENVVGGTAPADRNLISGHAAAGVYQGGPGSVIQGNLIGTDATGTLAIANGIGIQTGSASGPVGGTAAGAGNVISGNGIGILITQGLSNVVVQGNRIGTNAAGTGPLGNGDGIQMNLNGGTTTIGGLAPGAPNVIAYNGNAGVNVTGNGGSHNAIRGNSIYSNGGLGIELGIPGPNSNDPGDADSGSNDLQNFPIIQSVEHLGPQGAGSTRIVARLNSAAATTFDLDFYSNPVCSNFPREFVEGETYLGSAQVTTDGNGDAAIDVTLPVATEMGARISATATDPTGNTSEFSQRIIFSVTPASGPSAGGTPLAIAGTDFADPVTMTIGAAPVTPVFVNDHQLTATSPALSPGTVNDVVVTTPDGTTGTLVKGWVSDFLDVPGNQQFYAFVTKLVSNAITVGVGGGFYGVDQPTLRQQMAVFILKAKHGLCYTPPPCTGVFADVPCTSTFAPWIEEMAAEGITGGCGGGNFCPQNPVRRDQMAVFLLKGEHGSGYVPPPCAGAFADVACPSTFANWIEQLAAENITGGCGGGNYCPASNSTRGQMAVFITKTFNLQ